MVRTTSVLLLLLSSCGGGGAFSDSTDLASDQAGDDTAVGIDVVPRDEGRADGPAPTDSFPGLDSLDVACADDLVQVLRFGVSGDTDHATVLAGEDVPVLLEWALSELGDCTGCTLFVVLGVGDTPALCWDAGVPLPCPDQSFGIGAGVLLAPGQAGEYPLEIAAVPAASCDEARDLFGEASHQVVGALTVTGICADPTCIAPGSECGVWSNGCGGTCPSGDCGEDQVCSGDGICLPGAGCAPGISDIRDVYLNGHPTAADVNPGSQVTLSLIWRLGNGEACPDCQRQFVFGLDDTPLGCVEPGDLELCPSFDAGNFAAMFTAPETPGTYTLLAQALSSDDCADANERFVLGGPKAAVGVLRVKPPCDPADCESLSRTCGLWEDGCGGLLDCGGCPGSKHCTPEGACKPSSTCAGVLFEVQDFMLNGGGPVLGLEGSPAVALLRWRGGVSDGPDDLPAQVVVGLGDHGSFCREVGPMPSCAASSQGTVGGFLSVPGIPGAYPVRAALLREADCAAALEEFGDTAGVVAGIVRVGWDCSPRSCVALGLECGTWGDGCGYPLACGSCPDGQTCSHAGACETACSLGIFDVDKVKINLSGPQGSAAPGQQMPVALHWTLGNADSCDGCTRQLVVGIEDIPGTCSELGAVPACPETADGLLSVYLTAPTTAGDYTIQVLAPGENLGCVQAEAVYAASMDKLSIGTLHVTDGCVPENCFSLGAACGQQDDGCGFELDCGTCPAGDLCIDGACLCFADDAYEPNDFPAQATDLGTFPDSDVDSAVEITAMVEAEADWFMMGATDEMWAYVEPTAHVEMGTGQPYKVRAVYICLDGTVSETGITTSGACEWITMNFTGVTDIQGAVSGWRCQSSGEDLDIELTPDCPTVDDSGRFFISMETEGGCSSYGLWLHL